jgi:DNA-binding transcriptional LysR family regulator
VNDILLNLQRLSQLELRQICYFMAVVEAGNNFSKAADRLQIEQPPLSQRIRALEKALKVELFDRTRRPVQLTEAGQVFLEQAQQSLLYLQQGITQAQRASKGEIGRLAIGISSAIANTILPGLIRIFRQRRPDVTLEFLAVDTEQQMRGLRDRQLDIVFEHIPFPYNQDEDLEFLTVFQEELIVVLPESHPLAAQSQVALEALAQESILLPPPETFPYYGEVMAQFEQAGFPLKVNQTAKATWMIMILSLVAAEVGVAILPASNVQNIQRTGVVYRAIANLPPLTRSLSAVWRQDNSSPVLHEFLKVVQEFQTTLRV